MSEGTYVEGSWYFYAPNKGAAIFFTVAFCATGVVHAWQSTHYKCWILTPLFPFCALLFTVGFVLRSIGGWHYDILNVYIASLCITYAAPPLLELQNYHVLGRILYYVPYHSPLHPGRVLTTFGFISAIIEALNGWGASYSVNQSLPDSQRAIGHGLIKTALLLQLVVAACFLLLAGTFHHRCRRHGSINGRLSSTLLTLYVSVVLIVVRTVFRTVEYFGVAAVNLSKIEDPMTLSPLLRYEAYFYVFEGATMIINSALFNVRHPRRYLPESNKIYLAEDGVTEVEGPGFEDGRPFWQTLLDPFGLWTKDKASQAKFWEKQPTQVEVNAADQGKGSPNDH
ncbi:unnamed protein product [Clonostachys byssicola]|uniref:RTA1 domain protein n=1 Tax=Clonostachys byssicola TaxID=160290 RepID=A0A9N9U7Y1_9HYPO|nr:unnamed protein product [Clonostachys byssicola]